MAVETKPELSGIRKSLDKLAEYSKIPNYVIMAVGGTIYVVGVVGAGLWVVFAGLGLVATDAAQRSLRKK